MSRHVRHELEGMTEEARGELEVAVVKFDALEVLRDLAWSVDVDGGVWSLGDLENALQPIDRARFVAALKVVAELLPGPDDT